jgi:hypothetical protein
MSVFSPSRSVQRFAATGFPWCGIVRGIDRTATFWTWKEAVRPDCARAVLANKVATRSKAAQRDTEETVRTE